MKTLLLLSAILCIGTLKAQYIPNLSMPYSHPKDLSKKMDSSYVPGTSYKVEYYAYNPATLQWDLTQYYLVETDNYLLTKARLFISSTGTIYEYVSNYSGGRLVARKTSQTDVSGSIKAVTIDSFQYSGQNLATKVSWKENDSTYTQQDPGTLYKYDSLSRFIGTDGFNLPANNVIYSGYFTVDGFDAEDRPVSITNYSIQQDQRNTSARDFFQYDQLGRTMGYRASIANSNYDSCKHFYSDENSYPDSSLYFNLTTTSVYKKLIYSYNSEGKISEITVYNADNTGMGFHPYRKEVYTTVGSSGLNNLSMSLASISIYPNPCSNELTVAPVNSFKLASYRIYNLQGAICKQGDFELSSSAIDLGSLNNGFYLLQVISENGAIVSKYFIKENR